MSEQVREAHAEVAAMVEAHLKELQAKKEAAKRLVANAKSSAAVARRLAEEGSDMDLCTLAKVR